MSRIFFKRSDKDERLSPRRSAIIILLLASAGGGFVIGNEARATISPALSAAVPVSQVEVVLEALTVNVPGRGTLKFDARISIRETGEAVDRPALRDTALHLATAAGALPIVKQSQAVIPAINSAVGAIALNYGYEAFTIENAALYKTGI